MKYMKLGKDTIKPKKDSKFVTNVRDNWTAIKFAFSNLFYILLAISLLIVAGVAFWVTYEVDMYAPMMYATKFASILVALTAFYPFAKALTRR